MSIVLSARYSITYVEDLGSNTWRLTGKIYDTSVFNYSAPDIVTGDVVIDENAETGAVNRWKITSISTASGRNLVCNVQWDDSGSVDTNGPQMCDAAICRVSTLRKLAEIPTIIYTSIPESIQTRIHSINNRCFIDPTGTSGTSGTSGSSGTSGVSGTDGTSGISGTSGIDGTSGTSGTSGIDGVSGTSGSSGSSGNSGTSGTSGINGADGTSGSSGTSGTGIDGTSGTSGTSGSSGSDGTSGTSGTSGSDGTSGTSGSVLTYQYTNTYSASTSWVVSHNLGSELVMTQCYDDSIPKQMMMPGNVTLDNENQCTISWGDKSIAGTICVLRFGS